MFQSTLSPLQDHVGILGQPLARSASVSWNTSWNVLASTSWSVLADHRSQAKLSCSQHLSAGPCSKTRRNSPLSLCPRHSKSMASMQCGATQVCVYLGCTAQVNIRVSAELAPSISYIVCYCIEPFEPVRFIARKIAPWRAVH